MSNVSPPATTLLSSSPPAPASTPRDADVRAHFGLSAIPHTREMAVDKRWRHPEHERVLEQLRACVEQRMSAALIAPAGLGKSVVLRALAASLPEARFRVRYAHVTALSKRDLCRELCATVGCPPAGHYGALVKRLREHFAGLFDEHSLRPVLLIDEAHDLRPDVLKILRVLTNFEMDSRLVVSIVLCGQRPLRTLLRRPDMDAVCGRLACYTTLRLLSRQESREYVSHRCRLAGASQALFDELAFDALYEAAQGNLRALDRLALAALQDAAMAGASVAGADHVISARSRVWP